MRSMTVFAYLKTQEVTGWPSGKERILTSEGESCRSQQGGLLNT
jgi:hypothetical protein